MRRMIPFAVLLFACAKPETASPEATKPAPQAVATASTPEDMAKAMDLPIYPGAQAPQGMSTEPRTDADGSVHYSLVLASNDEPKKVLAWYGGQMGVRPVGATVVGKTKSGNDAIVASAVEAGRTLIRLKAIVYPKK